MADWSEGYVTDVPYEEKLRMMQDVGVRFRYYKSHKKPTKLSKTKPGDGLVS